MYAAIFGEFGMEGGGHEISLAYEDREAVAVGEDFSVFANAGDARRANVDHLQRAAGQGSLVGDDRAIDLPSVGVALDGRVEDAQRGLWWMHDFCREQNAASAGSKCGLGFGEVLEPV